MFQWFKSCLHNWFWRRVWLLVQASLLVLNSLAYKAMIPETSPAGFSLHLIASRWLVSWLLDHSGFLPGRFFFWSNWMWTLWNSCRSWSCLGVRSKWSTWLCFWAIFAPSCEVDTGELGEVLGTCADWGVVLDLMDLVWLVLLDKSTLQDVDQTQTPPPQEWWPL